MMADRKQSASSDTRTSRFPHLKPLSVYSHMVFQKATDSQSPDSTSWNLKVELSNSGASVGRKRRLDDSCLNETYDTPLEKPCRAKRPYPDSDSFGTFRQVRLVSPQSSSVVLNEIERVEKTLSDHKSLSLDYFDGRKTADQSTAPFTDVRSSSPVIVRDEESEEGVAFDFDVDEIMGLSPIDRADVSADGVEDFIQLCQTEQVPVNEGHSPWCSSRQRRAITECSLGENAPTGSDEGYFTKSYYTPEPGETKVSSEVNFFKSYKITIPNVSNDKMASVSAPIMSTPLGKIVKRSPILTPKLNLDRESWSPPQRSADGNLDSGNTEALPITPFLNVKKSKEGHIVHEGTSIHKSVLCHGQEKQTAEQVEEEEGDDVVSVSQQQADSEERVTLGEETDITGSFESTLPLQVQVKSKVVLPSAQHRDDVRETAHQQPEKKAVSHGDRNVFLNVPRPVVLYREEDWQKEKKVYVDLVTRHMTNKAEDGVMTELLHLMNVVANQGRGSSGRKWQHPSDLTRRNYRLRNSSRLFSLDEWHMLNCPNYRRFANVPQVFKRSPVL